MGGLFNSISLFFAVHTGPEKWGSIYLTTIPRIATSTPLTVRRVSLHFGEILENKHRFKTLRKPDKTIQSPYCGETRKHPNNVKFEREIRKAQLMLTGLKAALCSKSDLKEAAFWQRGYSAFCAAKGKNSKGREEEGESFLAVVLASHPVSPLSRLIMITHIQCSPKDHHFYQYQ